MSKRFTTWGNRIKRNGKLLNIEFKTKTDAKLCCKLCNQMDKDNQEYIDKLDEIFKWYKEYYGESILDTKMGWNNNKISNLEKENKELKSENQYLKSLKWNQDCIKEISIGMQQRQSLEISNNKLVKENEQLKQELKDYHNAFDCSQCKYQNYDWFDDGDEFEVCDKGNNEAQIDNHSCKDWEEL